MTADLRTRIAAVQLEHVDGQLTNYDTGLNECGCGYQGAVTYREHLADAVIAELDGAFVDFGLWLAEEITGKTMTRIDVESCHQEWKWLNDESRWIKGETDD